MPLIEMPGGASFFIDGDRLGEVIFPAYAAAADDPQELVEKALANPIDSPRLGEILGPGLRIAIIVDDITRETPAHEILPAVLEEVAGAGVKQEDVSIVLALGTHRPMTPDEIDLKIGPDLARKYRVVNVAASEDESMVFQGVSSKGIPVWVNKAAIQADVRIAVGMIAPHLDAGWGGGAKIILPGVCGEKTVEAFHDKMAEITTNQLGLTDAELRLDLEEFVGESVGLDFIVNAILNGDGRLCELVAGHYIKAHRAGVESARMIYGSAVKRRYPLVIAGAHPHHIDLWQSTKALAAGDIITADGGMLILTAECPEGAGPHPLFADYMALDPAHLLEMIYDGRVKDRTAAVEALGICRMKKRIRIGLVSSGFTAGDADRMGLVWYKTVEQAIEAELLSEEEAQIAVLTHGGVTLPILGK